ncbi:MAG: CD0415/CD1112 family protein [Lachnospiraceae bacterium]|nr:CD0415/CD1112 family protein [Lachnospiraceae bacterium]MDD3417189.1 CD0415/CD1112 family protein [Lachnospiraceae bacterium]
MDSIIQQITDWLKGVLVSGIMNNLTNTFASVNDQVGQIATDVAQTPSGYMPSIFNMVRNLSETVIMPIAGIILTFIACYELIQLIISYNNLASFETWFIWKWIFKTFVAVELITHTFDFTMAVFDVSQTVVNQAGGIIQGSTAIDASTIATMQTTIEAMELGPLFAIFLQSFIVQFLMYILSAIIFVIINGRMIEIYLMVSMAPIPFATFGNKEQSMMGQNYVRSLFALGFQGFLIMVCVGIYAVLIQSVAFSSDIIGSLWKVMGFTILLAFTLFKTGAVAKSILHAH